MIHFFLTLALFACVGQAAEVAITAHALSKEACRQHLHRSRLSKGLQPVQLTICNDSGRTLLFVPEALSLPSVPPEEVAKMLHTSVSGRAGNSCAATLFSVPAVVNGLQSIEENQRRDHSLFAQAARSCAIPTGTQIDPLVFIPKQAFTQAFTVTLYDAKTYQPVEIHVVTTR